MNGEENDTVRAGLTWRLRPLARVIAWLRVAMWSGSNGKEAILAEIGRIISSSLDINQVYDEFSRELVKLVPFERVAITLVEPARESFSSTYFYGTDIPERRPGRTVPIAGSFTGAVTIKNSGVLVNSLSETALAQQYPGLLPFYELGLRSFLGVPLRSKGKAIGAMMLHSARPNFYSSQHLQVAERVANQIASAIEIARLYKELQESVAEMAAVDEVARMVTSTLDIDQVYPFFATELKKLVDFDRVAIGVIDNDTGTYTLKYVYGQDIPVWRAGNSQLLAGTLGHQLATTQKALNRPDLSLGPAFGEADHYLLKAGLKSGLEVPLIANGKTVGILTLLRERLGAYGVRDQTIVEHLARQIAPATENTNLFETSQRAEAENAMMAEIGRVVSSSLDIEEVYERFSAAVGKLLQFDRIAIRLIDEDLNDTTISYHAGMEVPGVMTVDTQIKEVLRTREPNLVQLEREAELGENPDLVLPSKVGLRSFLSVPLFSNDKVIGLLSISSLTPHAYTQRHVDLLVRVDNQIAGAIANSQLYETRKRAESENAAMAEIGRIISSSLDIEMVYQPFANQVQELIQFDRLAVMTLDEDQENATITYATGLSLDEIVAGFSFPMQGSLTLDVVSSRSGRLFQATSEEEVSVQYPWLVPFFRAGLNSWMAMPLFNRNEVSGVLFFSSKSPEAYTCRDVVLAERIANQIAGAVANAQLYERSLVAQEEQRRLAQENSVIAEIGRIINSSLDIEQVYEAFVGQVDTLVPFDRIVINLVDQELDRYTTVYVSGLDVPTRRPGDWIPIAGTQCELVIRFASSHLIQIDQRDQVVRQFPTLVAAFDVGLRSFLTVPLMSEGRIIGILSLSSHSHAYLEPEVAMIESVANQIAGAIANSQLYETRKQAEEAERQRSAELELLLEAASVLAGPGSFEEKVVGVMEQLTVISDSEMAVFRVPDSDGLRQIGAVGADPYAPDTLPFHTNISAIALEQKGFLITDDYPNHPLATKNGIDGGVKSMLSTPVISSDSVLGVMNICSSKSSHFTPQRVKLLMGIINGLGTLLENAKLEGDRRIAEERVGATAHLASIGELAAGVAHEINNPLTSVLGYSEMVLKNKLSEQLSMDIHTIHGEAQRAAKIVQNLLFFARRSGTEQQYLDLNSVLVRSVEIKSYELKVGNIGVVSQLSPEIPRTMIDEHQLVQVFLNILTNAEQAIHKARQGGRIGIYSAISGGKIEITIRDDGTGMPTEVLSRIFEPFFTTKDVGQGTGLGLSVSYGIVKQHGGDIWAESVVGEGTAFKITLPVTAPEEIKVHKTPTSASTGKHLLVVDDEPYIRDLLRKYFELEPYTVDLAPDGREAWRKLQNINYDCILLDLKMPGMSGQELYQRIQEIDELLATRVVFITGDTVSLDTQYFISQTGNPVVTKPFRLEELLHTMHELWEN